MHVRQVIGELVADESQAEKLGDRIPYRFERMVSLEGILLLDRRFWSFLNRSNGSNGLCDGQKLGLDWIGWVSKPDDYNKDEWKVHPSILMCSKRYVLML